MFARQLGDELPQIGAHQVGRQAIDRRLEGAAAAAAAGDLRFVIAGEQAVAAADLIGREMAFEKMAGVAGSVTAQTARQSATVPA